MHEIIIITNDKERFAPLVDRLRGEPGFVVRWKDSLKESPNQISAISPALMVIDEEVDGISNLQIARQIVMKNAMINVALVSSLSANDFHEASEGLGILAQLPPNPGKEDAAKLVVLLGKMLSPYPPG